MECGPYDYTRSGNPTRHMLERQLADIEVQSLAPGSSANATVMLPYLLLLCSLGLQPSLCTSGPCCLPKVISPDPPRSDTVFSACPLFIMCPHMAGMRSIRHMGHIIGTAAQTGRLDHLTVLLHLASPAACMGLPRAVPVPCWLSHVIPSPPPASPAC